MGPFLVAKIFLAFEKIKEIVFLKTN